MMNKLPIMPMMIFLVALSATATGGERLTGEALKELLVGNTEKGAVVEEGKTITYSEFYRPDGEVRGTDTVEGKYKGRYEIKADGCFYGDYDGDEYDGCYYYEQESGNRYGVTHPNGESGTAIILKGDPENLNQ